METLRKVLAILTPRERKQAFLLAPLVTLMALAEVAGIASLGPFLSLLADPEAGRSTSFLGFLYAAGGFESDRTFLIAVGVLVLLVLVISNGILAAGNYYLFKFGALRNHSISHRLLVSYLRQPYSFFLERNSASLTNNILQEVLQVINGIVVPGLLAVSKAVAVVAIVFLLVLLDPALAALTATLLGGAYAAIYLVARVRLKKMGVQRVQANQSRFKAATEALGSVKELRLLGREQELIDQYRIPSRRFAIYEAQQKIITMLPRFALEAVAFGGMLIVVLALLANGASISGILPMLGVYAFAGYRLLPALNVIFQGLTRIRYSLGALDEIHDATLRTNAASVSDVNLPADSPMKRLRMSRSLSLCGVDFRYPETKSNVLTGIDIEIEAGSFVAIVGTTGSGKTTLVDLILGLFEPTAGTIAVDGTVLTSDSIRRWQRTLGYVPQTIYLTDDSIARNIAFGIAAERVSMDAVEKAAKSAQVHDFIESLPEGYATRVGERGVRLSGGQRQRLGIARALYHDPDVVVLDEATSALDGSTERDVFESLGALAKKKTLIAIAHRLTTVRDCDVIYLLEQGRITHSGTYDELLATSVRFREMSQQRIASD